MRGPEYTNSEVRDILVRSYKRMATAPFPYSHDGSIKMVAELHSADEEKVRALIEDALEIERVEEAVATSQPGDAIDSFPDTFPEAWAA